LNEGRNDVLLNASVNEKSLPLIERFQLLQDEALATQRIFPAVPSCDVAIVILPLTTPETPLRRKRPIEAHGSPP
jgi:hypothetical protein